MNQHTKKTIFLSFFIIIGIFALVAYYLFNKGPVNVQHSPGVKIPAKELYELFSNDSSAAFKKYAGNIVQVSGEVSIISTNTKDQQVISLLTNTGGAYINCTMEGNPGNIVVKQSVSIKGICSGIGQGEPDLGIKGDVYLTRCYLVN